MDLSFQELIQELSRDTDIENRFMDTGWEATGGGEGGTYGESNMETYITICKIDSQREFAVCLRELKPGLWNSLEDWGGREVGGRVKREGTYVHLWLIHADVWQKPTQYYKANILQLNINKRRKKRFSTAEEETKKELLTSTASRMWGSSWFIYLVGIASALHPSPPSNHAPKWFPGAPAQIWKPPQRATVELLTTRGKDTQSPETVEEVLAVAQVFPGQNQCHIKCFQFQRLLSKLFICEHTSIHLSCVAH